MKLCFSLFYARSSFESRAPQSSFAAECKEREDELGRIAGRERKIAELGQRFSVPLARTRYLALFDSFLEFLILSKLFWDFLGGGVGLGERIHEINTINRIFLSISGQKAQRLLPTNLYVVLFNFKGREADELDLK